MAYQALYRRLRPEAFRDMVGQDFVTQTLKSQVMNRRPAHAYLFCGSRGTGKTSAAKILARAINCEQPVQGDPCCVCETCRALGQGTDLDIIEIDAASNNGIDEVRDLKENIKYPPQYGLYKVYIIDEVHMMSVSAFNALLKTLEEPPAHVIFILATTEPQKLPATILSRCQRFDFSRLTVPQIVGRLSEAAKTVEASVTDEAMQMIARAAEGAMRDALSLLDTMLSYDNPVTGDTVRSVLGTADRQFMFRFAEALASKELGSVLREVNQLMCDGKEPHVFLRELSKHIRALLLAKTAGNDLQELLEATPEDTADFDRQATRFSPHRLIRMLEIFQEAEGSMRYAASPRTVLEIACVKACAQTEGTDTSALSERLNELEYEVNRLKQSPAPDAPIRPMPAAQADTAPDTQSASHDDQTPCQDAMGVPVKADGLSSAPVITHGKDVWNTALKELGHLYPSLYAHLSQSGRFAGVFGNTYRYAMPEQQDVFIRILNKEANKKVITEILSRVSRQEAAFEAVQDDPVRDLDHDRQMELARKELEETFGRYRVQEV